MLSRSPYSSFIVNSAVVSVVDFCNVDNVAIWNSNVIVFLIELLQLLKAHLDYKERTKLLASCDVMTDSMIIVNPRSVSGDSFRYRLFV